MISSAENPKLALAIELTKSRMPLLLPLLDNARISFDERIDTACVYPSGRILISPSFTANLGPYELSYIISHELLHLYYRSSEQGREFGNHHLVNVAHDLIINGRLSCEYMMIPPNDGLDWDRYDSLVRDLIQEKKIPLNSVFDCLYDYYDEYGGSLTRRLDLVPERLCPKHTDTISCWERVSRCSTEVLYALLKKLPEWLKNSDYLRKKYSSEQPLPPFVPPAFGDGAFDNLNPADFGGQDDDAASGEGKHEAQQPENGDAASGEGGRAASGEGKHEAQQPENGDAASDEGGRAASGSHSPEIHIHCLENPLASDVREMDEELSLFPDSSREGLQRHGERLAKTIKDMAEVTLLSDMLQQGRKDGQGGYGSGGASGWEIKVLNGDYAVPWERALQRWMDETAPRTRSWTSASRRLGDRRDICLPGRARNGVTAFFVLDTSGSMGWALPRMLGALSTFCQNNGVESVRLLQCDTDVCFDELVEIGELSTFQAFGGGGSDMSPAMERLAEDSTVQSVIVLTDGGISYPESVPYDVLWVLPKYAGWFNPSYGTVISMGQR